MKRSKWTLGRLLAGKQRWSRKDATGILKELKTSGLSLEAFADREQLDVGRLARWEQRIKADVGKTGTNDNDGREVSQCAPAFRELGFSLHPVGFAAALELVTRGGRVIRVGANASPDMVIEVVQALEALEC
jgi:hypothetical protein